PNRVGERGQGGHRLDRELRGGGELALGQLPAFGEEGGTRLGEQGPGRHGGSPYWEARYEGPVVWAERDAAVVWHGFTQMAAYLVNDPIIVERAEGRELIDVDGRRYLDAISSLWVNTLGHRVPELDAALIDQVGKVAHSTMLGNGNQVVI